MKRKLSLILIVFFMVGACAHLGMETTEKGQGVIWMNTYDKLKNVYEQEVAMPNLSDGFIKILNTKRELLIGLFFSIKSYNEYIDRGYITAETLNDIYIKYINAVEIPFGSITDIYEQYMETGELNFILLEEMIDDLIVRLTSMALSNM